MSRRRAARPRSRVATPGPCQVAQVLWSLGAHQLHATGGGRVRFVAPSPAGGVRILLIKVAMAVATGLVIAVVAYSLPHSYEPLMARDAKSLGDRSLLESTTPRTVTGTEIALTDTLQGFAETVRIDEQDKGIIIDRTSLTCHGGRARV